MIMKLNLDVCTVITIFNNYLIISLINFVGKMYVEKILRRFSGDERKHYYTNFKIGIFNT